MKPVLSSARVRDALFRLLRAAFRALPVGESTRDTLRQRFLQRFPTVRPIQPKGIAASGFERRPRIHAAERAIGYVERRDEPLPDPLPATLVAFYLPQFHTIPENDEWWGKGFTEWRNVTRALPQFEGHVQPRLPGDLGFYDLRNPQVMRDQAELAEAYGISAFCFYFYWFGGKTLLEDPLKQWLADSSIRLQYCLCWANENWTRRWDGRDDEILIGQQHSDSDDIQFIAHVAQYMNDPRYLRVGERPVLLVYRPSIMPDPSATAERWRAWCRNNGIGEICLAYVQSFERPAPAGIGFDCAVQFPPNLSRPAHAKPAPRRLNPAFAGELLDWREMAHSFLHRQPPGYKLHPALNCGWDNEPRRPGAGRILLYSNPLRFSRFLTEAIAKASEVSEPPLVFVNAWNEWAEGAVLEPDAHQGYAWLDAVRRGLRDASNAGHARRLQPKAAIVLHAWHVAILDGIARRIAALGDDFDLFVTTDPSRAEQVQACLIAAGLSPRIIPCANRGRDVLPFLKATARLERDGYDLILKVHTKRSLHRTDGDQWREELLDHLLEPSNVQQVMQAFSNEPRLGLVAPAGHMVETAMWTGDNSAGLAFLEAKLGLQLTHPRAMFSAGTMFWVRTRALEPLVGASISEADFEPEDGQVDGTLAHATERAFVEVVRSEGFDIATISPSGVTGAVSQRRYPYS